MRTLVLSIAIALSVVGVGKLSTVFGSMPQEDRGILTDPLTHEDILERDGIVYYVILNGQEYFCYDGVGMVRRKCARIIKVDLDNAPTKEGSLPPDLQRWQETEEMLHDRVVPDNLFPEGSSPYQGCPYSDIHRCNEDIAE